MRNESTAGHDPDADADSYHDVDHEAEEVTRIAGETGFGEAAVRAFADALAAGGGTMAQFHHPELGGSGQWSSGGMLMIGDMFNDALKGRVRRLAETLADAARGGRLFLARRGGISGGAGGESSGGTWWPAALGRPSSSGAQNGRRYAVFPDTSRLAVEIDGRVAVYDTGDLRIGGVSQSQGASSSLRFSTATGTVEVDDLQEVESLALPTGGRAAAGARQSAGEESGGHEAELARPSAPGRSAAPAPSKTEAGSGSGRSAGHGAADPIETIRRLAELRADGHLSEDEFLAKKSELLGRL